MVDPLFLPVRPIWVPCRLALSISGDRAVVVRWHASTIWPKILSTCAGSKTLFVVSIQLEKQVPALHLGQPRIFLDSYTELALVCQCLFMYIFATFFFLLALACNGCKQPAAISVCYPSSRPTPDGSYLIMVVLKRSHVSLMTSSELAVINFIFFFSSWLSNLLSTRLSCTQNNS